MFYTFRHLVHDTATALPVLCDRRVEKHRNPELWRLISVELFSPMHADPKDAVNIFLDTKCKKAIGMHWVRFFFVSLLLPFVSWFLFPPFPRLLCSTLSHLILF